jgi:EAL domain-containing protein (putative c-di-GMP-specific phosphodiesterase class I)
MSRAVNGRRYLLVELHNHVHLGAAYGEAFAANAMGTLHERVQLWGGSVMSLRPGCLLVTLERGASSAVAREPREFALRMECWQVELSAIVFAFEGRSARPAVTVRPLESGRLGPAGSGLHYPGAVDDIDAPAPQLPLPLFGAKWSMDYESDMALAAAVESALVEQRVNLAFQPVVRRDESAAELYAEGLLRVSGLPGGVGPARFIPVLERLGLVRALDRAVVMTVMSELEIEPGARLGCNVSACSLVPDYWWSSILERLAAQPEVASRLTIEITETAPLPDVEVAVAFVQRLKRLGCRIALDDFGAGHSSVAFARAAQPDVIKVDGGYLHRAKESERDARIFRRLVSLCRTLAPQVVAERVESKRDARLAADAGAEWLQGVGMALPGERHRCLVLADPDVRERSGRWLLVIRQEKRERVMVGRSGDRSRDGGRSSDS